MLADMVYLSDLNSVEKQSEKTESVLFPSDTSGSSAVPKKGTGEAHVFSDSEVCGAA